MLDTPTIESPSKDTSSTTLELTAESLHHLFLTPKACFTFVIYSLNPDMMRKYNDGNLTIDEIVKYEGDSIFKYVRAIATNVTEDILKQFHSDFSSTITATDTTICFMLKLAVVSDDIKLLLKNKDYVLLGRKICAILPLECPKEAKTAAAPIVASDLNPKADLTPRLEAKYKISELEKRAFLLDKLFNKDKQDKEVVAAAEKPKGVIGKLAHKFYDQPKNIGILWHPPLALINFDIADDCSSRSDDDSKEPAAAKTSTS